MPFDLIQCVFGVDLPSGKNENFLCQMKMVAYVPILCIVMLYLLHSIACRTFRVAPPLHDDTKS